jgi:SAM-dependent methyltransferase
MHVAPRIPRDGLILELGADGDPSSYARECGLPAGWHTADLQAEAGNWSGDGTSATILMPSEYEIPVDDSTYDVVLSGQVIEHVRAIWTWLAELARVTKPGGSIITISPVSWPYHEAPVDCWRIYPEGMRALAEYAGLRVDFAWWGSLEPAPTRNAYPGTGRDDYGPPPPRWSSLARRVVGWPSPMSVDLVTVAVKPELPRRSSS